MELLLTSFMFNSDAYPALVFGWRMVLGTLFAILGASLGSVGGVGGGGIFVPTLILICGFDTKTAVALSKCMILAQCASTLSYILRLKRTATNSPLIDYNLVLLYQPMVLLGISIGVLLNVTFPDWLVTLLLIILTLAVASRALCRGIETWKQETIALRAKAERHIEEEISTVDGDTIVAADSVWLNVDWKKLLVLVLVWLGIAILQTIKAGVTKCGIIFWVLNALQVPLTLGVTLVQAFRMHKNNLKKKEALIESDDGSIDQLHMSYLGIVQYALFGVLAGSIAGLLGVGGGATLAPLLLEFGIPPQTVSSTAILVMSFSSSLSVVEYYFLDRIPVWHALYFGAVCIISAYFSQKVLQKLINLMGRSSIIIFTLVFVVFVSGVVLGGSGIVSAIDMLRRGENMGFGTLCA